MHVQTAGFIVHVQTAGFIGNVQTAGFIGNVQTAGFIGHVQTAGIMNQICSRVYLYNYKIKIDVEMFINYSFNTEYDTRVSSYYSDYSEQISWQGRIYNAHLRFEQWGAYKSINNREPQVDTSKSNSPEMLR